MKNLMPLGLLASFAVATSLSSTTAFADYEEQKHTEVKNERRAEGQEFKAERDAARGNIAGAERHSENAAQDEHKARKDAHRANRDLRHGNY